MTSGSPEVPPLPSPDELRSDSRPDGATAAPLHPDSETRDRRVAERSVPSEARARQLQALAVELLVSEERQLRRISELLHDDLQQLLASARFRLQAATRTLPAAPALASVDELLTEAIARSRRLSDELSPAVLQHGDLAIALCWLARQLDGRLEVAIDVVPEDAARIASAAIRGFLFRAIRELLDNVARHAGVGRAEVRIRRLGDTLRVMVKDGGRGFDPAILAATRDLRGFGLLRLQERLAFLGGRLELDSSPGGGARVGLSVPASLAAGDPSSTAGPGGDLPRID
jgi:signal transduction histidine kinase